MSERFVGANVDGLRELSGRVQTQAQDVERISREATSEIQRLLQIWVGAGAEEFRQVWFNQHSPALRHSARLLEEAASTLKQNADRQSATSATLDRGAIGTGAFVGAAAGAVAGSAGRQGGWISELWNSSKKLRTFAQKANELRSNAQKTLKAFRSPLKLGRAPRVLRKLAAQVKSVSKPSASKLFRAGRLAGRASGVLNFGLGAFGVVDLIRRGNPIREFREYGMQYVADVAGTAFNLAVGAAVLLPAAVIIGGVTVFSTGGLAIAGGVAGAVWLGATVIQNWDAIASATSTAYNYVKPLARAGVKKVGRNVHRAASSAVDKASDLWDGATSFIRKPSFGFL